MKFQLGKVTSIAPLRVALADGGTPDVDPLPLVAGLVTGDMVWCQVEGLTLVIVGRVAATGRVTAWSEAAGEYVTTADIPSGNTPGPFAVSFPTGRFTHTPIITLGVTDTRLAASVTGSSVSGFNIYLRNVAATTSPSGAAIRWHAVQMTKASGTG